MNKRLLILVSIALGAANCGVTDNPIFVTGFATMDPTGKGECKLDTAVFQTGGTMDLAPGASNSFLVRVDLRSDFDPGLDTKGGAPGSEVLIKGDRRNAVNIDEVLITPSSQGLTFQPETLPTSFVVLAGSTQKVGTDLIGSQALATLRASPGAADGGLFRDMRVKIEFRGNLLAGGRVSSAPITFPITVFNSGFMGCTPMPLPDGGTNHVVLNGPCGRPGGQDGVPACCSGDPDCPLPTAP
jgi:hypothetical protein